MHAIGTVFIDVLVTMFLVGLAGSAVVVVISFVEDFKELFGDDEAVQEPHVPPRSEPARSVNYSYTATKESLHRF